MFRAFLTIAVAGLALISLAHAAPSFDCAKATTRAERKICDVPDLQWIDRQMARLYQLALAQNGRKRAEIADGQDAYLIWRDQCIDEACIAGASRVRLMELAGYVNVHDAFGVFAPEGMGGELWIVRFGHDSAFKLLTVGGGGHTCTFETDGAPQGGKGVIRYSETPKGSCQITVAPDGDDYQVVEAKSCSDYCGMRAVLDGRYKRKRSSLR